MDDRIMQAAVRAYEYATDDDAVSQRGLRAAVSRALAIQREEIATAIEAKTEPIAISDVAVVDVAERTQLAYRVAARIAREHGKEA